MVLATGIIDQVALVPIIAMRKFILSCDSKQEKQGLRLDLYSSRSYLRIYETLFNDPLHTNILEKVLKSCRTIVFK